MEQKPPEGLGSRDRILWAAATMLGDGPGAALSVRAVAARAGVSTGSLRHHFPTQRALMDAVLALVYDMVLPDDSVHDRSIPARDRLTASLQRALAPLGAETDARRSWLLAFERYASNEPTEAAREEYLALEREMRRRIEYCLTVLQDEGAVPEGDNSRRARFLITVVNGLSIAQAMPAEESRLQTELDVLHTAVDSVLNDRT
ncbi:TetR/AcrR family transcriptional regulator [Nocardiopsis sp. N85]|uniref:TetR/AcrR family transcriptional regulator n=1 Tax=Nocardiopsis sp. N85 TaxID=3029400 RepID=UPI00237F58F5|nr:TetR/AcrR family transcriptional regulator [Nocardiopsis sp. N85]MDE3720566.1 TetR/AcrR family transcriptional regulator [Nocardiopsis sp. N85]